VSGVPAPAGPSLPRWRAFPPLALGVVMAVLDVSVVNIALPTLSRAFHAPLTVIEWVVVAYGVTITALLLIVGRLADQFGRRRTYAAGLLVFVGASALCAAANGAGALIAARALQGLGAAMLSANATALLVASFPAEERGRALGAFGAAVGVGLAVGTPLGGLVIAHASWRWLFLLNLPLGLLAAWWLRRGVAPDGPGTRAATLDLPGAVIWAAALLALMLALSRGPDRGWGSASVWPLFVASAAALALFGWRESRARAPLLPIKFVRGPLGVAGLLTLISQALSIAVGFHMPLYLEGVLGLSPATSGQWLATVPLAALLVAPASGRLADSLGTRLPSTIGMGLTACGLACLSRVGPSLRGPILFGGLALVGVGQGLFAAPNASALLAVVPPPLLGLASGLQATMRNLGVASGSAIMAALVASSYAAHGGGRLSAAAGAGLGAVAAPALTSATRDAFLVLTVLAVLATVVCALLGGAPGRPPGASDGRVGGC